MSSGGGSTLLSRPLEIRPLQPLHREMLPKMNTSQNCVSTQGRCSCGNPETGIGDSTLGEESVWPGLVGIKGGGLDVVTTIYTANSANVDVMHSSVT